MLVATCTGGERGSILNPAMDRPDVLANISRIRREEMDRARAILGIEQTWLGFVDSGLPEGEPLPPLPEGCFALMDLEEATAPLVKVIRTFRPHVITTYDENGGYPHPDHIMCHKISVAAFDAAADPNRYPELGTPWQALKLYYSFTFHRDRVVALHEAMTSRGLESPYAERLRDWPDDRAHAARVTTRVPCAELLRGPRPGIAGPRHPGRPGRTVVHASRSTCTSGSGRPRTGSWSAAWCRSRSREDDLFAGSPCRPRVRSLHDLARGGPESGQAGLDGIDRHGPAGPRHGAAVLQHAETVPQDQRSSRPRPRSPKSPRSPRRPRIRGELDRADAGSAELTGSEQR